MAEQTLILGTLFTGKLAPGYKRELAVAKRLIRGVGNEYAKTGSKAKTAGTKIGQFNRGVQKGTAPLRKYGGAMTNLSGAFKTVLTYGAAGMVIMGVTQALRAGVSEIVQYDQALKNLEAISGATSEQLMVMGSTIQEIARTTRFSTSEIGKGMVLLSQAGFSASEAVLSMQAVADLATGTLTSMTTVSDLLTTSVRAFNLNASESGRVADVMANAVNKSKLTVDKLRIAFNFAGAASAQAGLSIEQTAASMMVLSDNGLRASTIGTGFRQVLKRLIAPNEKLKDAYLQAGVALDSLTIDQTQNYEQVLMNITRVLFDTKTATVDMAKAFKLFGLRGSQAAAILVKEFASQKFNQALARTFAVGTAARMASIQFKGLEVSIKNLKDNWGVLFIALGEAGIKGAMTSIVNITRQLIIGLTDLARNGVAASIVKVTLLTGAIFGTVKAVQALTKAFKALAMSSFVKSLMTANGIAAIGGNIWFLTALAISSVIVAVYNLMTAYKRLGERASATATKHRGTISSLESYGGALDEISKKFKTDMKNATQEYESTLKRLIQEHPKLADKIDLYTSALERNQKVISEAKNAERIEELKQLVIANDNLAKASKNQAFWAGAWKVITEGGASALKAYSDTFRAMGATTNQIASAIDNLGDSSDQAFLKILGAEEKVNKGLASLYATMVSAPFDFLTGGAQNMVDTLIMIGMESEKANILADKVAVGYVAQARLIRAAQKEMKDLTLDDYLRTNNIKMSTEAYKRLQEAMLQVIETEKRVASEAEDFKKRLEADVRADRPSFFAEYLGLAGAGEKAELRTLFDSMQSTIETALDKIKNQEGQIGKTEIQQRREIEETKLSIRQEYALRMLKVLKGDELAVIQSNIKGLSKELAKIKSIDKDDRNTAQIADLKEKIVLAKNEAKLLVDEFKKLVEANMYLGKSDLTFLDGMTDSLERLEFKVEKTDRDVKDRFLGWDRMFVDVGNSLVDNIANGFGEIASGADSMADRFQTMAQRMIQDMIALIAKVLMLKALLGATGGWSGNGFINKFTQAGLGQLGFENPLAKVGSSVSNMSNNMTTNKINNPIGNMISPIMSRGMGGNGGGSTTTTNTFKINAVDAASFNKLLSNRGARTIMVNTITSNKQHNGSIRKG